jgi:hypothetical protein
MILVSTLIRNITKAPVATSMHQFHIWARDLKFGQYSCFSDEYKCFQKKSDEYKLLNYFDNYTHISITKRGNM